jgi:hypothetical protein
MKRTFRHFSTFVIIFALFQCSGLLSTKIADIKSDPRRYADKNVTVSGEVAGTFSLLVFKYFTLRDKTGEITIVTQRPLPKKGERLTIKGVVREAFSLGSETLLVIVEEPEKAR